LGISRNGFVVVDGRVARKTEHALADDVVLDLVGAAVDRRALREQHGSTSRTEASGTSPKINSEVGEVTDSRPFEVGIAHCPPMYNSSFVKPLWAIPD
jgi:hypothetical protein